jgi:transcriptional regulator
MSSHPLGAWVCQGRGGLVANHVRFLLDRSCGPCGTLIGHVSRANTVWRELDPASACVVMFQGPRAYITPGWYPGKAEHGEVVPTWNYVVVHAHGLPRVVEDRDWIFDMLKRLPEAHESPRATPWSVSDAPVPFIERMMRTMAALVQGAMDADAANGT